MVATGAGAHDRDRWQSYERALIAAGLLRDERAPADAGFTNADLARNFREIIFYDEYVRHGDGYLNQRAPRPLEKRRGQVTYTLWGGAVTDADRAHLADIVARIGAATGLSLVEDGRGANIELLILDAEERRRLAGKLDAAGAKAMAFDLRNDLDGLVCAAYYFDPAVPGDPVDYTIIIPDEISGLLRRSCIEEEFGQAFGPSADFAGARPSIFNDDEEFALFTDHDAMLFRVLYDPRLRPGMDEEEAMPIVERIVSELRPNG